MHFLLHVITPIIGTTQSPQTLHITEGSYGKVSFERMIWCRMCEKSAG